MIDQQAGTPITHQLPVLPRLTDLAMLRLDGELHERVTRSYERILALYPDINDCGPDDLWPGDRSGRIIEALAVLDQYLGRRPERLDRLVHTLPDRLNSRGYVGRLAPRDELHTDQLWGNWFQILGLVAYWELTGDAAALDVARTIADGLFLSTLPDWEPYAYDFHWHPAPPHRWKIYVHPGAGLASGGGLIHLYRATGEANYLRAARQVAEMVLGYAWREGAHGHSALSMLINLVDVYALTGETRYLAAAIDGQNWVGANATSVNGEPYNLFLPRDTYMEGCGVGDWLVLNLKLWGATGEARYLAVAEDVLYNALFHVQRPSGSFGCDAERPDGLSAEARFFEADWCCSMRGGRALGELLRYLYATRDGDVLVNFYAPGSVTLTPWRLNSAWVRLVQETDYPVGGRIILTVDSDQARDFAIRLRMPACVRAAEVCVNGEHTEAPSEGSYLVVRRRWEPGDRCELHLLLGLRAYAPGGFPAQHAGTPDAPTVVPDVCFYHGPLLLGLDSLHHDEAVLDASGFLLVPRDGDNLILPSAITTAAQSRLERSGAHYHAVRLKTTDPAGFTPSGLAEEGIVVHLSPLCEHAGDDRCGPDLRVRYRFDCALFRDQPGRDTLDQMLGVSHPPSPNGSPTKSESTSKDAALSKRSARASSARRTTTTRKDREDD